MKTLKQLIDSLTLEHVNIYQVTTDQLMWIETDLLDPNGLSRRHALEVEDKILDLLQDYMQDIAPPGQYDAYLADTRRELDQ
jgi:hypothetical protein